jgi:hypothetical protein
MAPPRIALLALLLLAIVPSAARAAEWPYNELVNPHAEDPGPEVPGWIASPGYTQTAYGAPGEYPGTDQQSLPGGVGSKFFDPGTARRASLTQTIDLTKGPTSDNSQSGKPPAEYIDEGTAGLTVGGYLGGYSSSPDTANFVVTFLDAQGRRLGMGAACGPTAADRKGKTVLMNTGEAFHIPVGSRSSIIRLVATRLPTERKNHGYADELLASVGDYAADMVPAIPIQFLRPPRACMVAARAMRVIGETIAPGLVVTCKDFSTWLCRLRMVATTRIPGSARRATLGHANIALSAENMLPEIPLSRAGERVLARLGPHPGIRIVATVSRPKGPTRRLVRTGALLP